MKGLDLHCRSEHVFEGWFASEEDFQSQLGKGLVQCPLCGDEQVQKRLSAPRLNLRASAPARAPVPTAEPSPAPQLPSDASQTAAWLQRMRQVVARSEDVGERFTEEARKIHWGEADQRPIRGQANLDQTLQLLEEGIPVLPLPPALKEPLQ